MFLKQFCYISDSNVSLFGVSDGNICSYFALEMVMLIAVSDLITVKILVAAAYFPC